MQDTVRYLFIEESILMTGTDLRENTVKSTGWRLNDFIESFPIIVDFTDYIDSSRGIGRWEI